MTITAIPDDFQSAEAPLSYLRTVDRSLLHRRALSEVFLTDSRQVDESSYISAAQLPPSHAYYTDHTGRPGSVDPLLVLECCRQAETYGGHGYFGIGPDTAFIARSWSMHLPRLPDITSSGPLELGIQTTVSGRRGPPDRPTGLSYAMRVSASAAYVGGVSIDVGYLSPSAYVHLRAARRGSIPPPDIASSTAEAERLVEPARVGRSCQGNVVLAAPVFSDLSVRALVRVPLGNPSLFDHPLDHLPGMVLMEAARQACQLLMGHLHRAPPDRVAVVGVTAQFRTWAELDLPTTVHASLDAGETSTQAVHQVRVLFGQPGSDVAAATMTVRLMPPGPGIPPGSTDGSAPMILSEGLGIRAVATWLPPTRESAAASRRLTDSDASDTGYSEVTVATDKAPPQMAVLAARRALRLAGLDPTAIGLVIHTWIYHQGHDFWSPAHYVARELGACEAQPLGIQQMCNGSGAALEMAAARLLADPSMSAAVVTSADRFCAPGFDRWRGDYGVCYGDGAAAAVLHRAASTDALALLSITTAAAPSLEAMHRGRDDFSLAPRVHGTAVDVRRTKKAFLEDAGQDTLSEQTAARVRAVVASSLQAANVAADDPRLRCVALPRLGRKALHNVYMPAIAGVVPVKAVDLGGCTGHLGAGDMLANCASLVEMEMLAPGDMALLLSAGAGFTWTCAVVRRPDPGAATSHPKRTKGGKQHDCTFRGRRLSR